MAPMCFVSYSRDYGLRIRRGTQFTLGVPWVKRQLWIAPLTLHHPPRPILDGLRHPTPLRFGGTPFVVYDRFSESRCQS